MNRLQDKFPNTVPTVVRTGLKIALPQSILTEDTLKKKNMITNTELDESNHNNTTRTATATEEISIINTKDSSRKKWGGRKGRKGEQI